MSAVETLISFAEKNQVGLAPDSESAVLNKEIVPGPKETQTQTHPNPPSLSLPDHLKADIITKTEHIPLESLLSLKQILQKLADEGGQSESNKRLHKMRLDVFLKTVCKGDSSILTKMKPILDFIGFEMQQSSSQQQIPMLQLSEESDSVFTTTIPPKLHTIINAIKSREVSDRDPSEFSLAEVMEFVQSNIQLPGIVDMNGKEKENYVANLNESAESDSVDNDINDNQTVNTVTVLPQEESERPRRPWEIKSQSQSESSPKTFSDELKKLQEEARLQDQQTLDDGDDDAQQRAFINDSLRSCGMSIDGTSSSDHYSDNINNPQTQFNNNFSEQDLLVPPDSKIFETDFNETNDINDSESESQSQCLKKEILQDTLKEMREMGVAEEEIRLLIKEMEEELGVFEGGIMGEINFIKGQTEKEKEKETDSDDVNKTAVVANSEAGISVEKSSEN